MSTTIKVKTPNSVYDEYKHDLANPDSLNEVVTSLEPTIKYTLASIGAADDKVLKSQAKVIAAESVLSYDEERGSGLSTYVSNNLQKMHRVRRQNNSPIKISDRLNYDYYAIQRAENEFIEKHDREPDMLELADISGVSPKKIKKIKEKYTMQYGSEASFGGDAPEAKLTDFTSEAMDYIYYDSNYTDRKILEHSAGYNGSTIYEDKKLADTLKISVSQLSRRRASLAAKIYEIQTELEKQYNQ